MKAKRFASTSLVALTAIVASLLLITALASAQRAAVGPPGFTEDQADLQLPDGVLSTQAVPVTFPLGDSPWYAQDEIRVSPEPPLPGHPVEICAEVINTDPANPQLALLRFSVANFGIGMPFMPVGHAEVVVPPGGAATGCVVWVPPDPGHWCIEAAIMDGDLVQEVSQRNIDIWEPLVPGEPHDLIIPIGPQPVGGEVTFNVQNHMEGADWVVELIPSSIPNLPPDQPMSVTLRTMPPQGAQLGTGMPVVDVEALLNREPLGGIRKIDGPPVILHRFPEPPYAESEITVEPYPARVGEPTEICVELYNPTPFPRTVTVHFSWANFGIGLPFTPINGPRVVVVPPHSIIRECINWVPPVGGHVCLQVTLHIPGYVPQVSQRNIDVDEPLMPGMPHTRVFPVGNPLQEPVSISLMLIPHQPDWLYDLSPDFLPDMLPNERRPVSLTVTPRGELPPDGAPVVDVEAWADDVLIGGFRKIFRPPIQLHRFPDPPYAEREISVHPYPPMAGEPTEICVELYNPTDMPMDVEVQFSWANFGIGIPFMPINGPRTVHLPPHSMVVECIHWIPPVSGHVCLQVELFVPGHEPQRSQRNIDVDEPLRPGTPHQRAFPVGNPLPFPVSVTLGLIPHVPDDWILQLEPDFLPMMAPDEVREVFLTVTPGDELPPDGAPVVDVEAWAGDELIGGFRKVFRPPIQLHRFPDPPYAEREIRVHPYPPMAGEPTEICVELYNPTDMPMDVEVQFSWANFGIGIPFTPIGGPRTVHLPPFSMVVECIHWIPPVSGHVCLQVELFVPGHEPQRSQRNIDVDEPLRPGTPHQRVFPVGNPFPYPVSVTLGLIPHVPDDWILELEPDFLPMMEPDEVREVVLTVTPGGELPPDGAPVVDVEAFVEGQLIGGFRKIFRPPVPIHRPEDPIYAESEIFVHPYPPRAFEPTELAAELRNMTDDPQLMVVVFSVANFGIGLPWTPVNEPIEVEVPPHGVVIPGTMWLPPDGGLWCIQVEVLLPGHEERFYSQRNIDVNEPLEPGVPHPRPFPVGNPFTHPVSITLGLIPHVPDDWILELEPDFLPMMQPDEVREVVLTVTPGNELPPDGAPIVDVEAFVEGELIGGFRKIFRPPVPIHRPRDPVYAESEIGVDPYPVLPGRPVELSVEVFNPTDHDQVVSATFSVANFGIGLPFSTAHIMPNPIHIFVPAHGAARGHVVWNPPDWAGKFCVRVELELEGHEVIWSQRNIDVGEPLRRGEPHTLEFPVGSWPFTDPVTIALGLINHRDGWEASLSHDLLVGVGPGQQMTVSLTVTPPVDPELPLGIGEPVVDVEAFVDGAIIGGFRKLDRPPIPIHKPHEKGYAESEISIDPDPPLMGQPARVSTEVQNTSGTSMTVNLEFGWAKFGMGIPFSITGMTPYTRAVHLSPGMAATASVTWVPVFSGSQCIRIILSDPGGEYEPQESQRNVRVLEDPPCGQHQVFHFIVHNTLLVSATVDLGMMTWNWPEPWVVTTVPSGTVELGPFAEAVVQVHVWIPCPGTPQAMRTLMTMQAMQQQAGGVPTVDVEGYIDGELVGGIELRFPGEIMRTIYLPLLMKNN